MKRGLAKRLARALLCALAACAPVTMAWAYFSTSGAGSVAASATTLAGPTISSATPGAASVSLSWSIVTPPGSGAVSYYVTRDGGTPAGNCPTSASPSGATSCTDSGVSIASHTYRVIAVWRSWTATSQPVLAQVTLGPASQFVLTAATTTPTAGAADNLTITAKDELGNTATTYTGSHTLTFGGAANSPNATVPTVSNASGTAVNFGSATAINFVNGVATVSSSANGVMKLYNAGPAAITVSDGTIKNGTGLTVTVGAASAASLSLAAATTTPTAGAADNLTITAKDSFANTATSYTGSHNLTFGPVADSPSGAHATVTNASGTAVNFGTATAITFASGATTVSGSSNGVMTLVKAGATSITVSDGTIKNGTGVAVTVGVGTPARLGWTHATSTGTLSSPCLFTCTGTGLGSTGNFKANVSVTDGSGNTVSSLGSGHTVSVTASAGTITGGSLTIASTGAAESTTQFTYAPSNGTATTLTAATSGGTAYTSATATMTR
jgi:hypothetical protein